MWLKLCDSFSSLKWTIVSGVFLLASLILMLTHTSVPVDPAWVTVVLSGYPLLYLAITRLVKQKWISSCLLISIAMVASLAIGELFAAGEVAWIMAIGAILEDMTVARARKGLSQLLSLAPTRGRRLVQENGTWKEELIRADEIREGDLLRVLPGETVPVDGVIEKGVSSVDQSVITGESLPVDKAEGDQVFCGTLNRFGSMDIRATAVGQDSSLQKLITMVQQADEKKAPTQRIADKWAVWLVPIALLIAIGGFAVNYLLGAPLMDALERGVTVLVVFCPCALALATPTTIMAAIGQATKRGVIIKSGEALEAMGRVDTIAFDKTGTLTCGTLTVSDVVAFGDLEEQELTRLAGAAEARSEHPLGRAIAEYARSGGTSLPPAEEFAMQAGRGIRAGVEGRTLLCGSRAFLEESGVPCDEAAQKAAEAFYEQGKAVVFVAGPAGCLGLIALSDVLRPDAPAMIAGLKSMDTGAVLLTGDNRRAARHFAELAGLEEIRAELLPAQKVEAVEQLQKEGRKVCMIGDGINDAPALKSASVGVAMGLMGSDIAVEAADIALMRDDLDQVLYLRRLSRSALNTIRGNITASMCINAVAVTLSVLGVLNPVTGALVHNAGSVLVVLNAALLYDRKFD